MKLNYDCCYDEVLNNQMMRTIDYKSSGIYEEADTKIIHHICQLKTNYRVKILFTESHIPLIMLANMKYIKSNVEIMIDINTITIKETFKYQ